MTLSAWVFWQKSKTLGLSLVPPLSLASKKLLQGVLAQVVAEESELLLFDDWECEQIPHQANERVGCV